MTEEPCPECATRPYLCFEHHEALVEDEETLRLFAERWDARLAREDAFAEKLARDVFWWGRKVGRGEMLTSRAQELIEARVRTRDETLPIRALMLPYEAGAAIAAKAFEAGHASVRR